jgi:hypothetical protein
MVATVPPKLINRRACNKPEKGAIIPRYAHPADQS